MEPWPNTFTAEFEVAYCCICFHQQRWRLCIKLFVHFRIFRMALEVAKNQLKQMCTSVPDLSAIIITDLEAVPILRATSDFATGGPPEMALGTPFLSTYPLVADLVEKTGLGLGKQKRLICFYQKLQVVIFNMSPFVVTCLASENANTQMILELQQDVQSLLKSLDGLEELVWKESRVVR